MRRALLPPLLLLTALVGCDALGDDVPAWAEVGTAIAFDYTPGPDSLRALGPDREPPFRRAEAAARAVVMRVDAGESWEHADRIVEWGEPSDGGLSRFASDVRFPLATDAIRFDGDGLRVVVATDCRGGGGWVSGGSHGTLAFVRVPHTTGTLQSFGNCATGPGRTLEAARTETVTVPAGTFEVVVVEDPAYDQVEFWSWEAGLVRLDVLNAEGTLRGRFERSAE